MSNFIFDNIIPIENQDFSQGNFLWIWHADKIPPHVGISVNGNYFSLKFNGKDDGIPTEITSKIIQKKEIPSLLIELKNDIQLDEIQSIFNRYEATESNKTTCLTPLIKLFDNQNVSKLNDLLLFLSERQIIGSVLGAFLPENYSCIPCYSVEQIHQRLKKLQDE